MLCCVVLVWIGPMSQEYIGTYHVHFGIISFIITVVSHFYATVNEQTNKLVNRKSYTVLLECKLPPSFEMRNRSTQKQDGTGNALNKQKAIHMHMKINK